MKRLILYHNDADGKCAAAIAARWANENLKTLEVQCVPVNYGEEPPWKLFEALEAEDPIWIVDFSYDPDVMVGLAAKYGERLYWFDHHKTAIEKLQDCLSHFQIAGLRENGVAGCMLVWRFCHKDRRPPLAVEYIADRDLWQFKHGEKTKYFYEKYLQEQSTHPMTQVWTTWFEMMDWQYDPYLKTGEELYRARRGMLEGIARRMGYECRIASASKPSSQAMEEGAVAPPLPSSGPYKVLKVNFPGTGDMGDVIRGMGYDIAWVYHEEYRGGRMVRVNSLYSEKVDVGEIAKGHGGGGHKGAAGFVEVL